MRHRNRGRKLGRHSQERRALMRSLARSLILAKDGRIVTTPAKAKEVTPFVHRLVTMARHGGVANFRRILAALPDKEAAWRLTQAIAPQMANRPGGYTRILHLGGYSGRFRAWSVGDAADKVLLEFVDFKPAEAGGSPAGAAVPAPEKKGIVGKLKDKLPGKSKKTDTKKASASS